MTNLIRELPRELHLVLLDDTIRVEDFSCHAEQESIPLETFFRKDALDNQHKRITVTYVAVTKDDEPIGFFSIACGSIRADNLPERQTSHMPVRKRYPALYIGRLAVADNYRNRGVGTWMMEQLFARAIHLSREIGCRYIIVQSKPLAKDFYEKHFRFIRAREMDNGSTLYYKNMNTLSNEFIKNI